MSREEFRMRLEELILKARPDLNLGDMYNLKLWKKICLANAVEKTIL